MKFDVEPMVHDLIDISIKKLKIKYITFCYCISPTLAAILKNSGPTLHFECSLASVLLVSQMFENLLRFDDIWWSWSHFSFEQYFMITLL